MCPDRDDDTSRIAELQEKIRKLEQGQADARAVARANAHAAELMADLVEKNRELARANAHAAELMAEIELRDERIEKLNKALANANARAASLMADLELSLEELQRSNQELERFAFAASHDLLNPLRTISGFIALSLRKCPPGEHKGPHKYLELALDESERMMRMLDDLLDYARLNVGGQSAAVVSLEELLHGVENSLAGSIQEQKAVVTHGPLPTVSGFPGALSRLLQNLVSNALKFRGRKSPEIHLSARKEDEGWVVSVQDNGIGLAPEHAERVFKMFQRLHASDKYDGTGMGLAICKKIVDLHGGRIWVDSEPEHGACFSFFLPFSGPNCVSFNSAGDE